MTKQDDFPPSYTETPRADASSSSILEKAVFRLRVWHYCVTRWSVAHNRRLADLFRQLNLEHWIVKDATYIHPGESCERDDYVPVEVEFQHRELSVDDTSGVLGSHVRDLYAYHAALPIYDFFLQIRSTPHAMNIYSMEDLPGTERKYNYAKVLCRLNIRVQVFVVPNIAAQPGEFRTALETEPARLDALAALVEAFAAYLAGVLGPGQAGRAAGSVDRIEEMLTQAPLNYVRDFVALANAVRGLYAASQPQKPHSEAAHLNQWNCAQQPRQALERRFCQVTSILKRVERGERLGNQDVYDLVRNLRQMKIDRSRYEVSTTPIQERLKRGYQEKEKDAIDARSNGVSTLIATGFGAATTLFTGPVGLAFCLAWGGVAAVGIAGATATVQAQERIDRAKEMIKNLGEVDITKGEAGYALDHAFVAAACVYCYQILHMPLHIMGEHEKVTILSSLGVDEEAMTHVVYQEELRIDRLRRLHDTGRKYMATWDKVAKDANLRTISVAEED